MIQIKRKHGRRSSFSSPEENTASDIESITQPLLLCNPLFGVHGEKGLNYNSFTWNIICSLTAATYGLQMTWNIEQIFLCDTWLKQANLSIISLKLQPTTTTFTVRQFIVLTITSSKTQKCSAATVLNNQSILICFLFLKAKMPNILE